MPRKRRFAKAWFARRSQPASPNMLWRFGLGAIEFDYKGSVMKNHASSPLLAILVAFAIAAPAMGKDPSSASGNKKTGTDPNEVICEKTRVLGSRLAVKRICMTRAQWAEARLSDRQELERVQVQRGSCEGCQ